MRILLCLHSATQYRHFVQFVEAAGAAGHEVTIATTAKATKSLALPESFRALGVRLVPWPLFDKRPVHHVFESLRMLRVHEFYRQAGFTEAAVLRDRVHARLDPAAAWLADPRSGAVGRWVRGHLAFLETCVPPRAGILRLYDEVRPDIVLVSPLISHLAGVQTDFVKAAHARGLPVGLPVFSWDNLTTKGCIHEPVDHVFVWNRTQVEEARDLHDVDPARITSHGAWRFDGFRARTPSVSYEAFCAAHGLDPAVRTVVFLGSSPLICREEGRYATMWLEALRADPRPAVSSLNVVLRPHPRNAPAWREMVEPGRRTHLQATDSSSMRAEQELFDLLYHSAAAVGINTSAMLEAAVLGRPVFTILHPLADDGQRGVVHFEYLVSASGGLLTIADSFAAHVEQLHDCLAGDPAPYVGKTERFRLGFIDDDDPEGVCRHSEDLLRTVEAVARAGKTVAVERRPIHRVGGALLAAGIESGLLPLYWTRHPEIESTPNEQAPTCRYVRWRSPSTWPVAKILQRWHARRLARTLLAGLDGRFERPADCEVIVLFDQVLPRGYLPRMWKRAVRRAEIQGPKLAAKAQRKTRWRLRRDRPGPGRPDHRPVPVAWVRRWLKSDARDLFIADVLTRISAAAPHFLFDEDRAAAVPPRHGDRPPRRGEGESPPAVAG